MWKTSNERRKKYNNESWQVGRYMSLNILVSLERSRMTIPLNRGRGDQSLNCVMTLRTMICGSPYYSVHKPRDVIYNHFCQWTAKPQNHFATKSTPQRKHLPFPPFRFGMGLRAENRVTISLGDIIFKVILGIHRC